jgi:signal transduction histidine kinase
MPSLAEAACELPWLAPCAGSLVALTRQPSRSLWFSLRGDPGLVLLLLRETRQHRAASSLSFYPALLREPRVLNVALDCLERSPLAFVDWHQPRFLPIYRTALACAHLAHDLAEQTARCDPDHAWVGGLLAPLGWMAAAAIKSDVRFPTSDVNTPDSLDIGHRTLNIGHSAIARRLAAQWHLPGWLNAVVGHLGLPLDAACDLGAEPNIFVIVQLAVALVEEAGFGLQMPVGASRAELATTLELTECELQSLVARLKDTVNSLLPPADWQPPSSVPLLAELLRLALENRQLTCFVERDRLHDEVDALHNSVQRQRADECQRLQEQKLRGLAELAAGAGHEINNPLAVISGQAQYLLVSEQEPARREALQTIVGQCRRIHQTLTQLMQFARPPVPQKQPIDLGGLLREVIGGLQTLADERQIRLGCTEPSESMTLLVDPGQIRVALAALLRNGIEAAPAGGWASLRIESNGWHGISAIVEDNGPGLSAADHEHLFDPFYSGRRAGRGRGLGLSIAWQFARQHGGEVRFEHSESGPTRFILTLPCESPIETLPIPAERNAVADCQPLAQSA